MVERLATVLGLRSSIDNTTAASGTYIDAMGLTECEEFDILLHQIKSFNCDLVIVLDSDKIYNRLSMFAKQLSDTCARKLDILKMPRSSGITPKGINSRVEE